MSVWINNGGEQVTASRAVAKVDAPAEVVDNTPVINILRRLLADVISFYLRAHGYHWNVIGSDFAEYHALFEAIYTDVYESVDPIAENIRKLDGMAPFRLPELMALRSLNDNPVPAALPALLSADLLDGNEQILVMLNDAFAIATAANQQGIANFIAERIDNHQKWSWQLKSSIASGA